MSSPRFFSRLRPLRRIVCLALAAWLSVVTTASVYPDALSLALNERRLEAAEKKFGAKARARLEAWQNLINTSRALPESEKLQVVNDFFNQVPFIPDAAHWNAKDYWATPSEMLATNGGDCEDYSIAKYFTLVALGVPVGKLRITYVKAATADPINQAHMVLTYYPTPSAVPLVLDNLIGEIRPASRRPDLTPVYAFNGAGLWLAKERGEGKSVAGGSNNIAFWRELNARMGREFDQ